MSAEIKVVVVDDHPLFRRGVVDALTSEPGICVVGEACNAVEAAALVKKEDPDVLVLDIELPDKSGLQWMKEMRAARKRIPVVMLTIYREERIVNEALNAGVNGYVLKEDSDQELIRAIRAVHEGKVYLTPSLSSYLMRRMQRTEDLKGAHQSLGTLTVTEWKVLQLVASNRTSSEIAAQLFMSLRTVQKHREHMCSKLKLRGPNKLLEFALKHRDEIHHACALAEAQD